MPRLPGADPLLTLAVILVAGMGLGWAARRLRLPGVTGQITAGVLIGPSVLSLFGSGSISALEPLTHFALALIGVTVGAHLNVRRLRNAGRRLFWLLIAEALITPVLVGALLFALTDATITLGVLLATLAVSTAPATIIALVRETRARGVFVKTLVAAVAINNMTCIVLFELARGAGRVAFLEGSIAEVDPYALLAAASLELLQALAVGASVAVLAHLLTLRVTNPDRLTTISVISLLGAFGIASHADVSPLLACMVLGAVQTNLTPARDRLVDSVFSNFEPVILCVFFTLAGYHLSFDHAWQAGTITVVFLAARTLGKVVSAGAAMRLAGATERVRRNLGIALVPQAGVAVGLLILIQGDPAFASVASLFTAIVLTAVTANEIVGPFARAWWTSCRRRTSSPACARRASSRRSSGSWTC